MRLYLFNQWEKITYVSDIALIQRLQSKDLPPLRGFPPYPKLPPCPPNVELKVVKVLTVKNLVWTGSPLFYR